MIVYLARDIPAFVMYCVNGESGSSLLIESTDSMIESIDSMISLHSLWNENFNIIIVIVIYNYNYNFIFIIINIIIECFYYEQLAIIMTMIFNT